MRTECKNLSCFFVSVSSYLTVISCGGFHAILVYMNEQRSPRIRTVTHLWLFGRVLQRMVQCTNEIRSKPNMAGPCMKR